MDGKTYVPSKMRPLKSHTRKKRTSHKNNRISTEKFSFFTQNKNFLTELWQLLFFTSTSIFLILTFLNQAWKPISFDQTKITGLSGITKNDIKKTTSIFYPKNLLEINPKEVESYLLKKFPIKGVSVSRTFFPPEIHLNILEREPIAFASRVFSNNFEKGMIDIEGSWIPLQFVNKSKQNKIKLSIENWNPNKKKEILLIIKNRFIFQSPLQKIKINPLQEISLKTEHFDLVLIGSGTDRLIEQINKLNQLQKSLPNLLINTKVKIVDLKDPTKPELKVERILNDER
ncbi:cell division protein FtsQ/DivIB [Prochlorococcus sp. MIT 0801]|uniref:cell division protein FtsQ/DivIB n=1 Tax=Prochlorococcus sp. MIT 0801 TaxID=1501269 RepID=UPI0004F81337|nr:FtsQ-type POTRA domain-containing protein [Prochlorococcus sp. MIT 0801]AIQ97878.1 Cell division protein FtsQ [Prochlorococcus sp. MIT 0801]